RLIKQELNWEPAINLEKGITMLYQWIESQN
ncbi:MAG: hypothetical protein RL108_1587, partial [Bacteroidota bacterium]